eukprot:6571509-Prymnesium_polylepis.1
MPGVGAWPVPGLGAWPVPGVGAWRVPMRRRRGCDLACISPACASRAQPSSRTAGLATATSCSASTPATSSS